MSGWKTVSLADICEIERGGSPRPISDFVTNDEDGVNWIKITDATASGKCIYATEEKIIPDGVKRSRMVYPGDFILSNSMSFGRPYIMQTSGCIHDGWLVLRKPNADTDFLYYILSSEVVSNQFESLAAGSTVRNLNVQIAKEVKIPLPPLAEQRKIAEILRTWDEAIETAEAELKAKQALHQGLLQRAFSQGECIAAGGGKPLGEVVTLVKGKKPELYNEQFNGAAPYLVARFIRGEEAPKFAAQSDKNAVRVVASDIVIICDGSNSGEMFTGLDGVLSSTMAKLIPVSSDFEKAYIRYFVGYNGLRLSEAQEGGAIPHLDREKLLNFRIPMLEKKEQEVVVERLNASERAVQFVKQRTELLRTQKRGLMQKLLTGEVRVAV